MKRRSRASLARRSSKATSICASIVLSEVPRRPTSVRSSAGSTRRDRSPAAIAPAVSPMPSSGRSPTRTSHQASPATSTITPSVTRSSIPTQPVQGGLHLGERDRDDERAAIGQRPRRLRAVVDAVGRGRGERRRCPCRPPVEPGRPAGSVGGAGVVPPGASKKVSRTTAPDRVEERGVRPGRRADRSPSGPAHRTPPEPSCCSACTANGCACWSCSSTRCDSDDASAR